MKHQDLALLCASIYSGNDGFDHYEKLDNVVFGIKSNVIVFRGSQSTEDWIRDFDAIPEWHEQLGFCHSGFLESMDDVFSKIKTLVNGPVIITGHSLGGARARILAALFICNKLPVEMLCVFGSPKPGFINLARIIQKSGVPHFSYRNRNDVVPTLALMPYWEHTEEYQTVNCAPDNSDFSALRDHSIDCYTHGLTGR